MTCLPRVGQWLLAAALMVSFAQPASGQPAQPAQPGQVPRAEPAPQPRQAAREPVGRPVNIQIELTISDQVGSEPAEKKTVSMIVADQAPGRIRASGLAQMAQTPGPQQVSLNVDARPTLLPNDAIRVQLTVEYQPLPPAAATDSPRRSSQLTESLAVILQSGKTLTISRAVDPFTNRRTSVEVTATILK